MKQFYMFAIPTLSVVSLLLLSFVYHFAVELRKELMFEKKIEAKGLPPGYRILVDDNGNYRAANGNHILDPFPKTGNSRIEALKRAWSQYEYVNQIKKYKSEK